jgi:hypothetical protein
MQAPPDIAATRYLLPADAKCLPLSELSARVRSMIGPAEEGQSVITRPGSRVTAKLVNGPLAALVREFREPSLITDAVLRFSKAHEQDPFETLDGAFDALAILVTSGILVPSDSVWATVAEPGFGTGQTFLDFEIETLVRSLDDSEVYRARRAGGASVALKIAREDRADIAGTLEQEARLLDHLGGVQCPRLLAHGSQGGRAYVAMEWCEGVSIAVAAQQARASRDRRRLHRLVSAMLDAYGRLHAHGVLHGDIHPGNCLLDDDAVVLLDFGRARLADDAAPVQPARAGVPQFYDPAMASALLAGALPPDPTPLSEQYSLAVLAYLLLTGLYPIETPALQKELLRHVVARQPLPFAARGVAAWPNVEGVIGRALAKDPGDRYPDVAAFARAFASAGWQPARRRQKSRSHHALDAILDETRALAPSADPPLHRAWFALRAALALEDAELLAAADVLIGEAEAGWPARSVAAHIARARSDAQMERAAIDGFVAAVEPLSDAVETIEAILAAAEILQGIAFRNLDADSVVRWSSRRLEGFLSSPALTAPGEEALLAEASLSLGRTGAVALPPTLDARLAKLGTAREGSVWLWALAHDSYARSEYRELALAAARPRTPEARGFALLRLHQLTGEMRWIAAASRITAARRGRAVLDIPGALLMVEMATPERATLPFFLRPQVRTTNLTGRTEAPLLACTS